MIRNVKKSANIYKMKTSVKYKIYALGIKINRGAKNKK